jgi:D-alanyl-D-alanine dipeptidase
LLALTIWLMFVTFVTGATAVELEMETTIAANTPKSARWSRRDEPMVEVTQFCPSIFYELRYATTRNFTGQQIYPRWARCLLRKGVALRLKRAQEELRRQGYGLKIWDAYRPAWAQEILWKSSPNPGYVATPSSGGSWHTWGASVDVTLVDLKGRELPMPTDFDDFTVAAKSNYEGGNTLIATHVSILRTAMRNAGFTGVRDEWWHFTDPDAYQFAPVKMPLAKNGPR